MELAIIVAKAKNGVIGIDNTLPWHLPADLKHFKQNTLGHPIIMGRKTWESLGRPLPGRRNIVITRDSSFRAEGAECFNSIESAVDACQGVDLAFIIGGAQIYEQALDLVSKLVITEVDIEVVGDAHFPEISEKEWKEIARESYPAELAGEKQIPAYAFVTYSRI